MSVFGVQFDRIHRLDKVRVGGSVRSNPENRKLKTENSSIRHLYVHIPFCHHICPYCGFYKHQPGKLANRAFVDALLTELGLRAKTFPLALETLFFGGGTPTLLSRSHLGRLLGGIADITDLSSVTEWTLEANPATFDLAKATLMKERGVTRVSLGVQSWQPATLATLGRDHSPEEAAAAYHLLREAGFTEVGIDLMFSVPGQTPDNWQADLDRVIALQPEHVSAYNLTYEEDTEFLTRHQAGELDSDEDRDATLFEMAIDQLESVGYRHYEISNYARPGHESRHNQAYWQGADYLGIGPGAVSTVGDQRWTSLPDTAAWVARTLAGENSDTETEQLTPADRRTEAIALRLRTREGIPESILLDSPDQSLPDRVESLIQQGFLTRDTASRCLGLTRTGRSLADEVAAQLL